MAKRTPPAPVVLTQLERIALRALHTSSMASGHDFAFTEDAVKSCEGLLGEDSALVVGGLITSLQKKGIITVWPPQNGWTQTTWVLPLPEVEALLDAPSTTFHVEQAPAKPAVTPRHLDNEAQDVVQLTKMATTTQPAPDTDTMVEVCELPDGARFRYPIEVFNERTKRMTLTGWSYGVKLWHNQSRVRVRLQGEQKQVAFAESNGKARVFESRGATEMNYPHCVRVVRVSEGEYNEAAYGRSERKVSMDGAQAIALQAKYDFQAKKRARAEAAGDQAQVDMVEQRLAVIRAEAEEKGVTLHDLATTTTHAASTSTTAEEADTTMAKTAKQTGDSKLKKANAERKARLTAKQEAKAADAKAVKAAKPAKPAKEKKLAATRDCLCGCGLETSGKFRPGHDARVKGMLLKVERGDEAVTSLPESLRPYVKFAGHAASAGKENSDYRIVKAPVKFPGRDEIEVVAV